MDTNSAKQPFAKMSSREARARWRDLLDEIYRGSPGIVIERYGKPVAALVSFETFKALQPDRGKVQEETAVYHTKPSPSTSPTGETSAKQLQRQIQSLPADAQKLVSDFVNTLQQQLNSQLVMQNPTVALPATKLADLTQLLTQGYDGDALADSEALYDDV